MYVSTGFYLSQFNDFRAIIRRNNVRQCCNRIVATIERRKAVHLFGKNVCRIAKKHLQWQFRLSFHYFKVNQEE